MLASLLPLVFALPPQSNEVNVIMYQDAGNDYKDFYWRIGSYGDQDFRISYNVDLTNVSASFKMVLHEGTSRVTYVSINTNDVTVAGTNVTFSLDLTNIPPVMTYKSELWGVDITTDEATVMARGKITVTESLHDQSGDTFNFPVATTDIYEYVFNLFDTNTIKEIEANYPIIASAMKSNSVTLSFDSTNLALPGSTEATTATSGTDIVNYQTATNLIVTLSTPTDISGKLDNSGGTGTNMTFTAGTEVSGTLTVTGVQTNVTDLIVLGNVGINTETPSVKLDVDGNVNISGTLGFDGGNTINNIVYSMSAPGSDDNLVSEQGIVEYVSTISGSLQDDVIWEVVDTPTDQIRPKIAHITKALYHGGNVTIAGDLTVSGTTTTINSEELTVEDKVITVNFGEAGAGITGDPHAGMQIDRG